MLAPLLAACGARGADDLRPRARPHGRHARQARLDPRLRLDAGHRGASAGWCARPAARSSARPPTSRPPTAGSTRVRDATGTVESIPLIVASILSKKLAEGLDALVMDVKTGSGAFMAAREDAEALAQALVEVAAGAGLPTVALLTDMDEVLGTTAGNALEVREAIDYLTGARARAAAARGDGRAGGRGAGRRRAGRRRGAGRAAASARSTTAPRPSASPRWCARSAARATCSSARTTTCRPRRSPGPCSPERPGCVTGDGLPRGRPRGHRAGRQPPPRGRRRSTPPSGLSEIAPVGAAVGPDRPLAVVHARGDASAEEAVGGAARGGDASARSRRAAVRSSARGARGRARRGGPSAHASRGRSVRREQHDLDLVAAHVNARRAHHGDGAVREAHELPLAPSTYTSSRATYKLTSDSPPHDLGPRPDPPLAELHVHLEGTAPPALIRRLAERNGIPVPDGVFADARPLRLGRLPRLPAHLRPRRDA